MHYENYFRYGFENNEFLPHGCANTWSKREIDPEPTYESGSDWTFVCKKERIGGGHILYSMGSSGALWLRGTRRSGFELGREAGPFTTRPMDRVTERNYYDTIHGMYDGLSIEEMDDLEDY